MTAQFPSQIRTFTPKVDLVNTVYADHINLLQEEVRAVQTSIGIDALTSTWSASQVFSQTASWTDIGDRLTNIEAGLQNGVSGSVYFRKTGDTITPIAGTVGLALTTASGTANLVEARSAASVLNFNIDKDGLPKVGSAAVVYVGSSDHTALTSATTAAVAKAEISPFTPFLLAGL